MEKTLQFSANGKGLFGILHLPDAVPVDRAVLMVIGGPQTRIASHRMYVQMARFLCDHGLAVLRFDYEGMGDSHGDFVGFENAGASIRAAVDLAYTEIPGLKDLVLWSLCDGAAAGIFYASTDRDRITAMILANPYVHTEEGEAQTILKHYYVHRFFEKSLWKKVFSFRYNFRESLQSLAKVYTTALNGKKKQDISDTNTPTGSLPQRVLRGIELFKKPITFLISTNDMTGLEFRDLVQNSSTCKRMLREGVLSFRYIKGADHTFSISRFKEQAFKETLLALAAFDGKQRLAKFSQNPGASM